MWRRERTLTAVDVPLAQAILALAVLLGLQWAFGWLRRRSPGVIVDDSFGDGSTVMPFVQESRERAGHLGDHTPKEG